MKLKITYHRASTDEELHEILALQKENLPQGLSSLEKQKEGFVTLHHSFKILKQMNDACAHCIAKFNGKVIGYALSMLKDFKEDVPILVPMFNEIDNAIKEQNLAVNYIVMGQICISKNHRGQGVFRGLYNYMAAQLKNDFDAIITEIDAKNIRSSNAHKAIGFKSIKEYTSNNQLWCILSLDL